jgi:FMN phosphatase YigB (HAD superfamily)
LKPNQDVPRALITELLQKFSSKDGYDLYPDVKDFFLQLQNHATSRMTDRLDAPWPYNRIVVGIITNSDDRVPSILESLGLKVGPRRVGQSSQYMAHSSVRKDIDFVVHSYDVGHEKPDRRIFDAATSLLTSTLAKDGQGITSDDFEKLYVGDDLEKDYEGAEAAGWHAVLLDRNGVMDKAKGFHLGRVGVKNKKGRETKVIMAKTLLDLERWLPIR